MWDDGTRVVIQFFTSASTKMNSAKDSPKFKIRVTLPDGTEYKQEPTFSLKDVSWSKEK